MNLLSIGNIFKKYDFSFFGAAIAIFFVGIINLYSATHSAAKPALADLYKVQILWFVFSLMVGIAISFIRPKTLFRFSYTIYLINVLFLVLVLLLGHKGMGAQRWLDFGPIRFQPSEFMKIALVLALGRWYTRRSPDQELGLKNLLIPAIITFIPALLIIAEPDLGTGLLIILIALLMSFYKKIKWKTVLILAIVGLLSGGLMYKFGLKQYQQKRLITFLDPHSDAQGAGYNAIQSKIAIGSGKFLGKGFKKSSQASLHYLPENHTDFVFSIFNEEHGFFGSLVLISLYLILLYRFIWLATSVTRFYNSITAIGLMGIFFWHTFINMGMVTAILPIVGLPLPLMSYGGSSLMTFGIALGISTSISNSKNLFQ